MTKTITVTIIQAATLTSGMKNKKIDINAENVDRIEDCKRSENGTAKIIMKKVGALDIFPETHYVIETREQVHNLINKDKKAVKPKKKAKR